MRWASITDSRGSIAPGVVEDDVVYVLDTVSPLEVLVAGGLESLLEAGRSARRNPREIVEWGAASVAPPLRPATVRDTLGYHQHMVNAGGEHNPRFTQYPQYYYSNPGCLTGPFEDVRPAPGTEKFDYELEIAAVIGPGGTNLSVEEAEGHVIGYTIFNDWSSRDIQIDEMTMRLGTSKGKDTASTLGPVLVTADEFSGRRSGAGFDIEMSAYVNGTRRSNGNWSMIDWSVSDIVAYVSRGLTLMPGDVIATGTIPGGCLLELSRQPGGPGFLAVGDVVELDVELVGRTRQVISDALPVHPLSSGH